MFVSLQNLRVEMAAVLRGVLGQNGISVLTKEAPERALPPLPREDTAKASRL